MCNELISGCSTKVWIVVEFDFLFFLKEYKLNYYLSNVITSMCTGNERACSSIYISFIGRTTTCFLCNALITFQLTRFQLMEWKYYLILKEKV